MLSQDVEHLFHYTNPGRALGSLPSPRAPVWAVGRLLVPGSDLGHLRGKVRTPLPQAA